MLVEYRTKTKIGVTIQVLLPFVLVPILFSYLTGTALDAQAGLIVSVVVIWLIGAAFIIWGCCNYMIEKGYNWAWGFLGLLSLLGLIILACFPDKYKDGIRREARGFEVQPANRNQG